MIEYPKEYLIPRENLISWMYDKQYTKAIESLEFASKYHTGLRKDGRTPEIHHQVSIALFLRTLSNLRNQESVLISTFLHDLVEDYNVELLVIAEKFGSNNARSVALLSRIIGGIKKPNAEYYDELATDPVGSIVKGGDRIHNFQTCSGIFTLKKQEKYIEETESWILPMLRKAKSNFPDQELAYENIKHALKGQIELMKIAIEAQYRIAQWENKIMPDERL